MADTIDTHVLLEWLGIEQGKAGREMKEGDEGWRAYQRGRHHAHSETIVKVKDLAEWPDIGGERARQRGGGA